MTDPDRDRETDDRPDAAEPTDAPSGFRFDCEFCGETLRATTDEAIRDDGVAHLEADHSADLRTAFAEEFGGSDCRNDCGYAFPVGVDEVAGFACPDCGHDHFRWFARRYLYWRIEEET